MKRKIVTLILYALTCSAQVLLGQAPIKDICVVHPSPLNSPSVSSGVTWTIGSTSSAKLVTQLVTITNPTNKTVKLGKLFIDGPNANQFALQNKTVMVGQNQRAEGCSNTTLAPNGSCSFRVAALSSTPAGPATLHVPGGGPCDLKIPVVITIVK